MAAARFVTWGLLLAAGIPAGARGTLRAGLSPGVTLWRSRDPLHGAASGHRWLGPSPAWEASGDASGTGAPGSDRWGDGGPVRWSPPLRVGGATGAARGMETTATDAGISAWRNGGNASAEAEEPVVAWRGHRAEGQDSPWGGTWMPHGSVVRTPGPQVPMDTEPGSVRPPWAGQGTNPSGQSASRPASTPRPLPTVSTVSLTLLAAAGTETGTSDAHTGGQLAVRGHVATPRLPWGTQLTLASSQLVPRVTVPVPHPTGTGPAHSPHSSPGSIGTLGREGDSEVLPSPSSALPSSAAQPPAASPSRGLAEPWTRLLPAHQRSTRRAPHSHTTASPGDTTPRTDTGTIGQRGAEPALGTPLLSTSLAPSLPSNTTPSSTLGTPSTGLLPEEDVGSPQRVRGAVGPMSAPNASEATPQPTAHPATGTPGTRHAGTVGTHHPTHGTATPSTRWHQAGVTLQAAPRHPSTPPPPPPSSSPAPGANGTGLRWAELRRRLGFAWEGHIYGVATTFLVLALGCLAGLAGAASLRPPHLPHVVGAHGLLLATCLLRATFLLLDPYGARGHLPPRALLLLSTVPFPMLLGAFALLLQWLQCLAQLQLLPARLQGLPALGAAVTLQSGVLGAADMLPPRLGPGAGLGLQALGCGVGSLLLLGGLWGGWRVLRAPREGAGDSGGPGLHRGGRALVAAAVVGLPVCGLQLYGSLWLRGVLGPPWRFSQPGWPAQLWLRVGELGMVLALLAAATEPLCCRCWRQSPTGHSCWAKALRYFCTGHKAEVPEYPNNCYDWSGGGTGSTGADRAPTSDISKSLIRNPAEQLPLRALKDSNEAWVATGGMPGLSPKCPNALVARSCVAFEQGSTPSLGELAFRPPSPIDLRRSIDQALCRRHLLHDSLFSWHRRGSGTSLHGSLAPTETPSLGRMVRCSSLTELPGPRQPPGAITITVTASVSSLDSSSLKISWNPWHHGLSSPDSLPLDEAPSRAPLLLPAVPPGWEREGPRGFPSLGKASDTRSLSSDTIEL